MKFEWDPEKNKIGVSAFKQELIVCYCYRTKVNNETIIRIFSARK